MKFSIDKKYRKILVLISIPILIVAQYFLFKTGILRPMVKGIELSISNGDYIEDIDQFIIKLNDEVELSKGDYIHIPSYAKDPYIWFSLLDNEDKVLSIQGKNKLIANKEGYATVAIMKNNRVLKKTSIKVVDLEVENLEVNPTNNLIYVGDEATIETVVEVDYKGFKEKEEVKIYSDDESIIKVEDNKIKAVGIGYANVFVEVKDKIEQIDYNIKAKVDKINIADVVEVKVGEHKKLSPKIITNPLGLKHPTVNYKFLENKDKKDRAISLDKYGNIVALKEGSEKIKITCGNKEKVIAVNVFKNPITDQKVKNIQVIYEIIDDKARITFIWDYIKDILEYELYIKNDSLQEKEFRLVDTKKVKDNELDEHNRVSTSIEVDLVDGKLPNLSAYIVGKTEFGQITPSDIIHISHKEEDIESLEVKNLDVYVDEDLKQAVFTWDNLNLDNVLYSVYVKDNTLEEGGFALIENQISTNKYIMDISSENVDIDVYVVANKGDKFSKESNTVGVQYLKNISR